MDVFHVFLIVKMVPNRVTNHIYMKNSEVKKFLEKRLQADLHKTLRMFIFLLKLIAG